MFLLFYLNKFVISSVFISISDAHDGALQPSETFEEEYIAPVVIKHEVKEEKSSSQLRRSVRRKVFASTPEDFNKISLREGIKK